MIKNKFLNEEIDRSRLSQVVNVNPFLATDLHSLVRIIWLLLLLLLRGLWYALLLIVLVIQRRVEARVLRHADAELLEGGVVENGVLVAG